MHQASTLYLKLCHTSNIYNLNVQVHLNLSTKKGSKQQSVVCRCGSSTAAPAVISQPQLKLREYHHCCTQLFFSSLCNVSGCTKGCNETSLFILNYCRLQQQLKTAFGEHFIPNKYWSRYIQTKIPHTGDHSITQRVWKVGKVPTFIKLTTTYHSYERRLRMTYITFMRMGDATHWTRR